MYQMHVLKFLSAVILTSVLLPGSQDIAKSGVGILGDVHKLQRDYGVSCGGLWDIYQHLQDRADAPSGGRGLASMLSSPAPIAQLACQSTRYLVGLLARLENFRH